MKYNDSSASESSANFESPFCYCEIPSKLRISGKATSFGKRFYNCPNYKINKQCRFFQWIDLEMELNTCCKMTLELAQRKNSIIMKERIMTEEAKFTAMKKKYKGTLKALYLSWSCFVLILAVIILYLINNYVHRPLVSTNGHAGCL